MIVCNLKKGQGLGNQLWNLAAAHQIATNSGKKCFVSNYESFKGKEFIDLTKNFLLMELDHFREISEFIPVFRERLFYDERIKYLASDYDSRIENIQVDIILEGLFQSEKYINYKSDNINKIFPLKSGFQIPNYSSSLCILNLRGGEYKRHKDFILPESYWQSAIAYMKENRGIEEFIVVTDDSRYAASIFPNFEIVSNSVSKCYLSLMAAKNLVVSNSTFSYFPIRASTQNPFVIGPKYFARHNSSQNIWASPANLYEGWNWLDSQGDIFTTSECRAECEKLSKMYNDNYNISVDASYISHNGVRELIPRRIRQQVKLLLSYVFPRRYG